MPRQISLPSLILLQLALLPLYLFPHLLEYPFVSTKKFTVKHANESETKTKTKSWRN